MSSKKVDRALYGPSWAEVFIGAALSLVLGVVLAAVLLILKPVQTVRELPKDAARGVVYYIEGSKDSSKGRSWTSKHQLLNQGTSVVLVEDELNAMIPASAEKPKTAAPADKTKAAAPAPAAPAANEGFIIPAAPNFRISDSRLQVAVPCTLNVYGVKMPVTVIATGGFAKEADGVVFVPDTFYLGSLEVNRLPVVEGWVMKKILASQPVPEDLGAAWKKLSDASVDGKTLKLTM